MLGPVLLLQTAVVAPPAYSGRAGQLRVAVPRLEAAVTIDGALDEPAWHAAARLIGFSEYIPVDGRPAEDSTEILVWYSPTAIYFGVRAFEPASAVHATLATATKSPRTTTSKSCSTPSTTTVRRWFSA